MDMDMEYFRKIIDGSHCDTGKRPTAISINYKDFIKLIEEFICMQWQASKCDDILEFMKQFDFKTMKAITVMGVEVFCIDDAGIHLTAYQAFDRINRDSIKVKDIDFPSYRFQSLSYSIPLYRFPSIDNTDYLL